jgi:hypothetical protein
MSVQRTRSVIPVPNALALVLNNLISIFRYYEKEPKKAQATANVCYIASKYKLGAERNY